MLNTGTNLFLTPDPYVPPEGADMPSIISKEGWAARWELVKKRAASTLR
jgi:hypothetical protein